MGKTTQEGQRPFLWVLFGVQYTLLSYQQSFKGSKWFLCNYYLKATVENALLCPSHLLNLSVLPPYTRYSKHPFFFYTSINFGNTILPQEVRKILQKCIHDKKHR